MGGPKGSPISPLVWLLRRPEWFACGNEFDGQSGQEGLQPFGAIFHARFFRRNVSEQDQRLFLSLSSGVAHILDRFPLSRFPCDKNLNVLPLKRLDLLV